MIDYLELDELLLSVDAEVGAAECHGFLCGQVCVTSYPPEELWQEFIDPQTNNDVVVDDCYREIRILLADIIDNIQSPDMDFQLILPEDNSALEDRVNALAEWCHGFLNGYGLSAGQLDGVLSAESREILEDFTQICRVGIDKDSDDEDEHALIDLIEYVRMGAIMIFDDLYQAVRPMGQSELIH